MSKHTNNTEKRIQVCHFGHKNILGAEGGVEVVVAELAKRQVALGCDVTCYNRSGHHVSGAEFDAPKVKEWNGVHVKYVPTIQGKGLAALSSSFFAALCAAFGRYDVVHIHAEGPAAFCWLPRLMGKRVVCTNHGLDWKRSKWNGGLGAKFIKYGEKMSAKYAHELIVLSKDIQQYFETQYGRKTHLIPNGVNKANVLEPNIIKEKFNLEKDGYILYLSRLSSEKRADLLIKAFRELDTTKKLVIAGGESDSKEYANELRELAKGDDRIIFTGFVNGTLKDELYSNAYLYVLPSDLEGMPLCLLEAMSFGNCCLVSDIPECAEVVGDNGIIFNKSDEVALRKELHELCKKENSVQEYKVKATDYIHKKYNWDNVVEQTTHLYR